MSSEAFVLPAKRGMAVGWFCVYDAAGAIVVPYLPEATADWLVATINAPSREAALREACERARAYLNENGDGTPEAWATFDALTAALTQPSTPQWEKGTVSDGE